MLFNIGGAEILVIAMVALIAVGPEQLPGVLRRFGHFVARARTMTSSIRDEFMSGLDEVKDITDPDQWFGSGTDDDPVVPRGYASKRVVQDSKPIGALAPLASAPSPSDADPASDPPASDPPASDPPASDPPASDPPASDPPASDPPASDLDPAHDSPASDSDGTSDLDQGSDSDGTSDLDETSDPPASDLDPASDGDPASHHDGGSVSRVEGSAERAAERAAASEGNAAGAVDSEGPRNRVRSATGSAVHRELSGVVWPAGSDDSAETPSAESSDEDGES